MVCIQQKFRSLMCRPTQQLDPKAFRLENMAGECMLSPACHIYLYNAKVPQNLREDAISYKVSMGTRDLWHKNDGFSREFHDRVSMHNKELGWVVSDKFKMQKHICRTAEAVRKRSQCNNLHTGVWIFVLQVLLADNYGTYVLDIFRNPAKLYCCFIFSAPAVTGRKSNQQISERSVSGAEIHWWEDIE